MTRARCATWNTRSLQAPLPYFQRQLRAGGDTFTSCDVDCDDDASKKEIIRREALSLEDCRRGANEVHLKREDTWRTSTADFLTSSRRWQGRENFQNQVIHELSRLVQDSFKVSTPSMLLVYMLKVGRYRHLNNGYEEPQAPTSPTQQAVGAFVAKKRHRI